LKQVGRQIPPRRAWGRKARNISRNNLATGGCDHIGKAADRGGFFFFACHRRAARFNAGRAHRAATASAVCACPCIERRGVRQVCGANHALPRVEEVAIRNSRLV
jgi:hypothetical protein